MSIPSQDSLFELAQSFRQLATAVANSSDQTDVPIKRAIVDRVNELRSYIPGLDPPFDHDMAEDFCRASQLAVDRGDERLALVRALHGLSFAPHHPQLFYLAASACFELGWVELVIRFLYQALWIHPGYTDARNDLESLKAFDDSEDDTGAGW